MADVVIDTVIIQKANARLKNEPGAKRLILRRVRLLQRIQRGEFRALKSRTLIAEYRRQLPEPRNDFVRAFLELIDHPTRSMLNWKPRWSGADREAARGCRFPAEDDHVLRTAIQKAAVTTIFSEEARMIGADACIYRRFGVHIRDPP
jgi:hypothetical protein